MNWLSLPAGGSHCVSDGFHLEALPIKLVGTCTEWSWQVTGRDEDGEVWSVSGPAKDKEEAKKYAMGYVRLCRPVSALANETTRSAVN